MKSIAYVATVMSIAGLVACGDGSTSTQNPVNSAELETPASRIVFKPADGELSVPSDLLFSGTSDGTLEMPDEVAARALGSVDYNSPAIGLGALDGWSTQMPFQLGVEMAESATLSESSVAGRVRIFETYTSNGATCNGGATSIPAGLPCAPTGVELTLGVDFITQTAANSITVVPLRPLQPATTYIVALLAGIEDSRGEWVAASETYQLLKDTSEDLSANASLLALQGAISVYEGMVSAATAGAIVSDDIIYSMAMTTQSVGGSLAVIKNLLAASPPTVSVTATGNSVRAVLTSMLGFDPGAAYDLANYYTGSIDLPYYSAIPTVDNPLAPVTEPWRAACDNGLLLASGATGTVASNDALCQSIGLRDFGLDSERHMTRYNPLPEARAVNSLEVQMTVPAGGCSGPCPVVMLQHGITSSKEAMLLLTAALANAGFATVAIDHPLHGSRGFDLDGDLVDDINASTVSATHYMNLAALRVARDNLRQSAADMLGLRIGLQNFTASDGTNLDTSSVHVVGHSLGAMSAATFAALANASADVNFNVQRLSLHNPGGGVAPFLVESGSFGSLVQASILQASGTTLGAEFTAFLGTPDASCAALTPTEEAYLSCQFTAFTTQLTLAGEIEKLATLSSLVSSFVFAAQALIDAGDPNNFAAGLAATATPIHLTEIIGDGVNNLPDQTIPNQTTSVPFGGTEPFKALLGLAGIDTTTAGSALVRFTKGHHGSLLSPTAEPEAPDASANLAVTTEIQTQVAYFLATGSVVVGDATYIAPAAP